MRRVWKEVRFHGCFALVAGGLALLLWLGGGRLPGWLSFLIVAGATHRRGAVRPVDGVAGAVVEGSPP